MRKTPIIFVPASTHTLMSERFRPVGIYLVLTSIPKRCGRRSHQNIGSDSVSVRPNLRCAFSFRMFQNGAPRETNKSYSSGNRKLHIRCQCATQVCLSAHVNSFLFWLPLKTVLNVVAIIALNVRVTQATDVSKIHGGNIAATP